MKSIVVFCTVMLFMATVSASGQQEYFDDFTSLSNWQLYGSPLPLLVDSIYGRVGIFDNNGDAGYNSGAISNQLFDLRSGFILESDVFLDFSNPNGCWAGADIGIGSAEVNQYGDAYFLINMHFNAEGFSCSGPPEFAGNPDLWMFYFGQTAQYDTVVGASGLANGWHTLKIFVSPNWIPSFYIDGKLYWSGPAPLADSIMNTNRPIVLGTRSSGSAGKAYHDNIMFQSLPGCNFIAGDANGDCHVLGSDVTYLVRYLKGIGPSPIHKADCE